MLGSRLARRIVLPVLILLALLFGVLGAAGVWAAERRVSRELDAAAERAAVALADAPGPPDRLAPIAEGLAALLGAEIVVTGGGVAYATEPSWDAEDVARLGDGTVALGGARWVVRSRDVPRGPRRISVLTPEDVVARRRRDALLPVVVTGGVGLLVAAALGLAIARTISRPVSRLAEAARRFPEGVPERGGPGEIGELQEAFARMLAAVRESEAKLRESERFAALGRLAGGIAHELRNPLTAVRMAVETATGDDAASRAEARQVALAELDRLERTLRELLDFVRPRAPKPVRVPASRLLREVAELLRPQCEHLKVALSVDAPEDLVVEVDPDRMKQALLNLVLNAAQAQPSGGSAVLIARPGLLAVRDAGPGVPPEVRATLFEPFVTTKAAGIGLGLAVVKQVAEEHGGSVAVETGPEGSTFTIRLG